MDILEIRRIFEHLWETHWTPCPSQIEGGLESAGAFPQEST